MDTVQYKIHMMNLNVVSVKTWSHTLNKENVILSKVYKWNTSCLFYIYFHIFKEFTVLFLC
jgi:hypothetical protein